VLADDPAILPFDERIHQKDDDSGVEKWAPVRILPSRGSPDKGFRDYVVPETFRLVGTMNDFDRAGLNHLSFAMQRRFAMIPVEAPSPELVKTIITNQLDKTSKNLGLDRQAWLVERKGRGRKPHSARAELVKAIEELHHLFAYVRDAKDGPGFGNLVSERIVGISIVLDAIRFVGEGLRASNPSILIDSGDSLAEVAEALVLSYLAIAVVLFVFPQLESVALTSDGHEDVLKQAVQHIRTALRVDHAKKKLAEPRLYRVAPSETGKSTGEQNLVLELKPAGSIDAYLMRELIKRFPERGESLRKLFENKPEDHGAAA
jgi:hypothetical protein